MVRLSNDLLTWVIRTTRHWRRLAMEDAGYLRARADRCLRLAKTVAAAQAAEKRIVLAQEYCLKAGQAVQQV